MISSIIISEFLQACFFGNFNFNLSQSSSGSDGKEIVFRMPEVEILKPGDLSNFKRVLFRVHLLLELLRQNPFPLQNHTKIFYPMN